jgi:hypothetical protein
MSILTGVVTQQYATNQGLTDTSKYLLLGWMLGSTPIGLGITLALANQEADSLPPPVTNRAGATAAASAPTGLLAPQANSAPTASTATQKMEQKPH